MHKRILSFFVTICLLLSCISAGAENVNVLIDNARYSIVLRTEAGDVPQGSGVLFLHESVLLTAEGCIGNGPLYAIGKDGEHRIRGVEKLGDSGAVLLEMDQPSSAKPLMLSDLSAGTLPWVFGVSQTGEVSTAALYQWRWGALRGQDALVLISEEGLLPGAAVMDEMGGVIALTVSQQTEGVGMYVALEANALYDALFPAADSPVVKTSLSWMSGRLNVSWRDAQRTNGAYSIMVSGDQNGYYTTFKAAPEQRSTQMILPPGHTYDVQVQWVPAGESGQEPDWLAMETYIVPELPPRRMNYTQECYYTSAPVGTEITEVLPDMGALSLDALANGQEHYLQVISRYDVTEECEVPMAVELIAPDGQFYFEEHVRVLSPEWEEEDCFVLPLDGLLTTCQKISGGVLPQGEYRLRYFLNGYAAGEYVFNLE